MHSNSKRTYAELSTFGSYEERFKYCQCKGTIGVPTFGGSRYLNQAVYANCPEWFEVRDLVIIRDNGCDLGDPDRPIPEGDPIIVHHLNPLTVEQVLNRDPDIFDPNNLVCCTKKTHNLLHYGELPPSRDPVERKPNDTCPWRK